MISANSPFIVIFKSFAQRYVFESVIQKKSSLPSRANWITKTSTINL
nr:MAG TPA: hypothetical protein [Caudoviricetes sp.]